MITEQIIYDALIAKGLTYVKYERPYHIWEHAGHRIGFCIPCGLVMKVVDGGLLRRRWESRSLHELIAFIDEGNTAK